MEQKKNLINYILIGAIFVVIILGTILLVEKNKDIEIYFDSQEITIECGEQFTNILHIKGTTEIPVFKVENSNIATFDSSTYTVTGIAFGSTKISAFFGKTEYSFRVNVNAEYSLTLKVNGNDCSEDIVHISSDTQVMIVSTELKKQGNTITTDKITFALYFNGIAKDIFLDNQNIYISDLQIGTYTLTISHYSYNKTITFIVE